MICDLISLTENVKDVINTQRIEDSRMTECTNHQSSQCTCNGKKDSLKKLWCTVLSEGLELPCELLEDHSLSSSEKECASSQEGSYVFGRGKFADLKLDVDCTCKKGSAKESKSCLPAVGHSTLIEKSQLVLSSLENIAKIGEDNYRYPSNYSDGRDTMLLSLLTNFNSVLQQYNIQMEKNLFFMRESNLVEKRSAAQTARCALEEAMHKSKVELESKLLTEAAAIRSKLLLRSLQEIEVDIMEWGREYQGLLEKEVKAVDAKKKKYQNLWKHLRSSRYLQSAFFEHLGAGDSCSRKTTPSLVSFLLSPAFENSNNLNGYNEMCDDRHDTAIFKQDVWITDFSHFIEQGNAPEALSLLRSLPLALIRTDDSLLHRACAVSSPSFELIEGIVTLRPELCKAIDSISGNSALHFICLNGKLLGNGLIFRLLIDGGAPISLRNHDGLTAFHLLVLNRSDTGQNHRMKEMLIEASRRAGKGRVDIDELTTHGQTALHLVCGDDAHISTTEFLVKNGADINFSVFYRVSGHPDGICRMNPLEKSTRCGAMKTYQFLRAALMKSHAALFEL